MLSADAKKAKNDVSECSVIQRASQDEKVREEEECKINALTERVIFKKPASSLHSHLKNTRHVISDRAKEATNCFIERVSKCCKSFDAVPGIL